MYLYVEDESIKSVFVNTAAHSECLHTSSRERMKDVCDSECAPQPDCGFRRKQVE